MDNYKMNHTKPKNKKPVALIVAAVLAVLLIAGAGVWFFWLKGFLAARNAAPVYVTSVASITGASADTDPRYSGLVEPQQITKIEKDESRTVADVMVQEGDQVQIGMALFRYDTQEMELSIRQAQLELEGINNQINTLKDQKKELEAEKKKAPQDEQYSYTVSIQSVEHSINEQEYQRTVKLNEIDKLKAAQENNQVISEVEGVVQEINLTPKTDSNGQPLPFMSILSDGEFRIKGTVTEQNINSIYEGQQVTIRSRVDDDVVWSGTIDTISYEPVQDQSNMYYYGGDMGEKSSKYNFYVVLSELEGLILGQHVYIEPVIGGSGHSRTGLWLPAMYVVTNTDPSGEGDAISGSVGYVWVRDENEKLEKRQILLGEYDSGEDMYEVISGLETKDYIAMPSDELVPGGPTTTDASAQLPDDMMGGEMDGKFFGDDGIIGGEFFPEGEDGAEGGSADGLALPEDGIPDEYEDGLEPTEGSEGLE